MSNTIYSFIRHAESKKNLKDITGGEGEQLTEIGLKQVNELINKIKKYSYFGDYQLCSSDIIQAKETASLLGDALNIKNTVIHELNPASMGVINGLSSKQIREMYPELCNQLEKWKNKEIEAVELNIPGMEKPKDFYKRVVSYINNNDNGKWNIIICTRSLMVLIYNLTHNHLPIKGGDYKHQDIAHCDMISFVRTSKNSYTIIKSMTSKELI